MTDTPYAPAEPTPFAQYEPTDLRLVIADMDGTLLDGEGRVPADLGEAVARWREAGVLFAPASGRQLANLHGVLGHVLDGGPVIAENGTFVVIGDEEVHSDTISKDEAVAAIEVTRRLAGNGLDVGAVVACKRCAYIDRSDERFVEQCVKYYEALEVVDDLLALPLDDVLKVAVYDFGDIEREAAPDLRAAVPTVQTVVSGAHWTDMMPSAASKGRALDAIQRRLGVAPEQTAAFGDYLNDRDLYAFSGPSFAMANAHPEIRELARYVAPANTDNGVIRAVDALLAARG
ncbi:sugar phosphatase [Actinomyces radicidentis]|uniref:Sugar phosphatase n=1 Tax=Actinomyces radicidentis TaxID=111015 RepID=A0A0X8JFN4_ACTRD|nr:HAD family hydrolase [Actinomyces radicidentis]AMD87985.1 sugar phosphatase [Actinomyces radicidentis]